MSTVKLKRLKIEKYRNVKPGTELHFDDGINLILGQNASGKTTLLALISAVCRGDFRELSSEEFALEAELWFENRRVTLLVSQRRGGVLAPRSWEASCRIAGLDVDVDDLEAVPGGWTDGELAFHFVQFRALDTVTQAFRFDESLDAFLATTGRSSPIRGPASPPPMCIEVEFDPEEEFPVHLDYIPHTGGHPTRPVSTKDDALCRQIAEGLDASDVEMRPELRAQGTRNNFRFYRVDGYTFDVIARDGELRHHDLLSYGQKRLLAFYYYLACNPSVVIADELVNGLHHRWIDACMKALGDRQAFLTSQNPLLFDYVEFDSVEQVQARFVTCRLEQVDGREQMVWENMHRDDAERFFAAYQAEIEHVGEILMNRGLW